MAGTVSGNFLNNLLPFLCLLMIVSQNGSSAVNITTSFDAGTNARLGPAFILKTSNNVTFNYTNPFDVPIVMKTVSVDPVVADIPGARVVLPKCNSSDTECSATLPLETFRIGRTYFNLTFYYENSTEIDDSNKERYDIRVIRRPDPISSIYGFILLGLQVFINFLLGCKMNIDVVRERLKRPVAVVLGVVCQILFMPLLAFGLAKAFSLPEVLALGLLVMGCSPGGGSSNYYSVLLDGDIDLSITMTLFTITLSFGTMPLWIFVYSRFFNQGIYPLRVPYIQILISVAVTVVPLFPGLILRKCKPRWTDKLCKWIGPLVIILVLFSVAVSIYNGLYIWEMMTWRAGVSTFLLPLAGIALGSMVAAIGCRDFPQAKTVAVETGVQNSVIAIAVVTTSQPQPEADIMMLTPSYTALFIIVLLLIACGVHFVLMKCWKRYAKLHEGYVTKRERDPKDAYTLDHADGSKAGIDNVAMET